MLLRLTLALSVLAASPAAHGQGVSQGDAIELFVLELEQAAGSGSGARIAELVHPTADIGDIAQFVYTIDAAPSRVVVRERDRAPLEGGGHSLLLEVFVERDGEGRLSTWVVDLRQVKLSQSRSEAADRPSTPWRLARMERLNVVAGLYRLALDEGQQFEVRDLTVTAPDLTLHMQSGSAFVAETQEGPTAVVLIGRGRMQVAPQDEAERTQIRIFARSNTLSTDFDAAFIRVRPTEFSTRFSSQSLQPRSVSARDLRRAITVFDEYVGQTLQIDLMDLSRDRWSLLPSIGDFIAEVRTRRHGSLTYARTWSEAEDISVFDRKRRRNITVYASAEKLAARGRFYSEDDLVDYDILAHDVDVAFSPDRHWIDGTARLKLRIRAREVTTLSLRLAESLAVRGVYSPGFGRLLHLRVVNQNSLIVNLPAYVPRDTELWLVVIYSGRLEPQELEREAITVSATQDPDFVIPLEPRYMYSNRSYWYPHSTVSDYATARLRITIPHEFEVVATGTLTGPSAPAPGPVPPGERPRKVFVFESDRPVRYLSCIISRFATVTSAELSVPSLAHAVADAGGSDGVDVPGGDTDPDSTLMMVVRANPRHTTRARLMSQRAADVFTFYATLMGDAPYPSFTLAVTESDLPGGHSPAYFVVLNQPLPTSRLVWRNDPVAFEQYPTFFLAHELAHQWWGQAVGWKNYHEQWLSEGFAQYFATLFAEEERGGAVMLTVLRQMRRWAIQHSDQGPVYLGYRLGHIQADSTIFRALVYNKGAMVLHMLRRLVGDEAFFSGLRRFYTEWRFRKAGTDDFRVAMEAASGRDLIPFFEGWIHGAAIPRLKFSYEQPSDDVLVLRFEHTATVIPVPVTVSIAYANGETDDIIVAVTERVVEHRVPLAGLPRRVVANEDHASLAILER